MRRKDYVMIKWCVIVSELYADSPLRSLIKIEMYPLVWAFSGFVERGGGENLLKNIVFKNFLVKSLVE